MDISQFETNKDFEILKNLTDYELELYLCGKSFKHFLIRTWKLWDTEFDLIWTKFLECICDHYQAVHDGKINRIIMLQPPRTAKSVTSKAFVAFHTLHYPWKKWIFASHSNELIGINMKNIRRVIDPNFDEYTDPFYGDLKAFWGADWGLRWDERKGTNFATTRGGRWYGTTPEAENVTGFDADGLHLDDLLDTTAAYRPNQIDQAIRWLRISALRRFRKRSIGIVISIAQTLHPKDPPNWLKKNFPGIYDVLTFPMEYEKGREAELISSIGWKDWRRVEGELLVPEYIDEKEIELIKIENGLMAYDSQYQQRARIIEFPRFPRDKWVPMTDDLLYHIDKYGTFYQTILSVDTAYGRNDKSDETAIVCVAAVKYPDPKHHTDKFMYLVLECQHGQWDQFTGIQKMKEMADRHKPDNIIVELEANGGAYIDECIRSGLPVIHGTYQHYAGKAYRADAVSSAVVQGLFGIPYPKKWSEEFIEIMENYDPRGKFGLDVADAFSQGAIWVQLRRYFPHPLDKKIKDLEKRMKKNEVDRYGKGPTLINKNEGLFPDQTRKSILSKDF